MRIVFLFLIFARFYTVKTQISRQFFTPLKITFNVVSRQKYTRPTSSPIIIGVDSSQEEISASEIKSSSSTTGKSDSFLESPPIPSNKFTSGNVSELAQDQAKLTSLILKSIQEKNILAQYLQPIFETSKCFDNLQDASMFIEKGSKLMIENLSEIIPNQDEMDIIKLFKAATTMLRTLGSLLSDLSILISDFCISSPDSIEVFQDLEHILRDITSNRNLEIPQQSRKLLAMSSNVFSEVGYFLQTLKESLNANCEKADKDLTSHLQTMSDIVNVLARLFESIGFGDIAYEVRKIAGFLAIIGVSNKSEI